MTYRPFPAYLTKPTPKQRETLKLLKYDGPMPKTFQDAQKLILLLYDVLLKRQPRTRHYEITMSLTN